MNNASVKKRPLSLYVHIPFCVRKCLYCDFLSFPENCFPPEKRKIYTELLCREIKSAAAVLHDRYFLYSVFIGGGTPSVLSAEELLKIDSAIYEGFLKNTDSGSASDFDLKSDSVPQPEYSIEVNPGTCTPDTVQALKETHINRVSVGLQSMNDYELRSLGRIHDHRAFLDTWDLLKKAGFNNINVDIMADIPGQTVSSYKRTLEAVTALEPEHISAYSLIVEPGTPFFKMAQEGKLHIPDEDTDRLMYHETKRILAEKGYSRYEISNYSKPGYACRHNLVYWSGGEYLGLGLGASSMIEYTDSEEGLLKENILKKGIKEGTLKNGILKKGILFKRFKVTDDIKKYPRHVEELEDFAEKTGKDRDENFPDISVCFEPVEDVRKKEAMEEFFFLGLRKTAGVSSAEFEKSFGESVDKVYGSVLKELQGDGLIVIEKKESRGDLENFKSTAEAADSESTEDTEDSENTAYIADSENTENFMIRLTDRGMDLSNYCMEKFLL